MKRLKNDLKKSKQQVVRHLIKCRTIETTIKQSSLTNDAIKNYVSVQPVEMRSTNQSSSSSTGNMVTSFNNRGGLSSAYLGMDVCHISSNSCHMLNTYFILHLHVVLFVWQRS
jgi:hypothetical protein